MNWTPYITLGIVTVLGFIGYIFKELVYQPLKDATQDLDGLKEDVIRLQEAFKYYVERQAIGAAKVLDSPNPTPPDMRRLMRKFSTGEITEPEQRELVAYLRGVARSDEIPKSERSAAWQMLTSIETLKLLPQKTANGNH